MQSKLDGYKQEAKEGKTLNEDQSRAVERYGEVLQELEANGEISKYLEKLDKDHSNATKKLKKREKEERITADQARLSKTIIIQVSVDSWLQNIK